MNSTVRDLLPLVEVDDPQPPEWVNQASKPSEEPADPLAQFVSAAKEAGEKYPPPPRGGDALGMFIILSAVIGSFVAFLAVLAWIWI